MGFKTTKVLSIMNKALNLRSLRVLSRSSLLRLTRHKKKVGYSTHKSQVHHNLPVVFSCSTYMFNLKNCKDFSLETASEYVFTFIVRTNMTETKFLTNFSWDFGENRVRKRPANRPSFVNEEKS